MGCTNPCGKTSLDIDKSSQIYFPSPKKNTSNYNMNMSKVDSSNVEKKIIKNKII